MMHRKRREEAVELNMAAMLDMAFQLLTFFILTFRPPPAEGQISLKLPPPQSMEEDGQVVGPDVPTSVRVKGVNTLVVSVFANRLGDIEQLAVGVDVVASPAALDHRLREVFGDPANPFEQVILQVDRRLRYDKLMRIVEVCTKQKCMTGEKLTKLSFVPSGTGG